MYISVAAAEEFCVAVCRRRVCRCGSGRTRYSVPATRPVSSSWYLTRCRCMPSRPAPCRTPPCEPTSLPAMAKCALPPLNPFQGLCCHSLYLAVIVREEESILCSSVFSHRNTVLKQGCLSAAYIHGIVDDSASVVAMLSKWGRSLRNQCPSTLDLYQMYRIRRAACSICPLLLVVASNCPSKFDIWMGCRAHRSAQQLSAALWRAWPATRWSATYSQ